MNKNNLVQKIINAGTPHYKEIDTIIRVRAMNQIMLIAVLMASILLVLGITIPYIGYVITSLSLITLAVINFLFTYYKKSEIAWHIILILSIQIFIYLPFFVKTSPSIIVFFISFQFFVLVFFKDTKIIKRYFIYYSICAFLFSYFLYYLHPENINNNPWINFNSLVMALIVAYYSLQFYIYGKLKTEEKIKLEEEKFHALFEHSPLGIMVMNLEENNKKMVNQGLVNLLGYTKEEWKSIKISQISHRDDLDIHQEQFQKLLSGEIKFFQLEKRHIHKNGNIIWGSIFISVIRDAEGKPSYSVATFLDQNEQIEQGKRIKILVKELQKVNAELEETINQRTKDLMIANDDLKRSNLDLEQFAYAASHDLKEPLRMISSFVQIIDRKYSDKIDDKGWEYIQFTIDGVQRMSDLISSLLQYSRVGRKESKLRPANMNNLIEIKLMDLQQLIADKKAIVNVLELPIKIVCEPVQIGLVFYNLINNALKFNENPNPLITIRGEERADDYLFSVQDNGIGIDKKFKEQVFEIFKRLHGREKYEGTGIGLALCRKIIYRHEGDIWLESEQGSGTTFFFTIKKDLDNSELLEI